MSLSLQKYVFWIAQCRNLIQSPSLFLIRLQTDQEISYRTAVLNNYFYIVLLDIEIGFFQSVLCRKSSFLTPTCTSLLLLLVFKTRNVLCQEQIELDFPLPCIPNLFGVIQIILNSTISFMNINNQENFKAGLLFYLYSSYFETR